MQMGAVGALPERFPRVGEEALPATPPGTVGGAVSMVQLATAGFGSDPAKVVAVALNVCAPALRPV